jgi:pyrimidine and pyridine-specific 5'-nucleotidase
MTVLIDEYFVKHLELSYDDAFKLHQEYYKTYGLAIEGLVRHHKIDPLEYNRQVDDALPLEQILFPDPELRKLLMEMDKSKVKLWLFTNAYVTHGRRVVKLLGIEDLFEGLTFCDYGQEEMICKPSPKMFAKAMAEAGVKEMKDCYFVGKGCLEATVGWRLTVADDSALNCRQAEKLGWNVTHLVEEGEPLPADKACKNVIRHLEELRTLYPQHFKSS